MKKENHRLLKQNQELQDKLAKNKNIDKIKLQFEQKMNKYQNTIDQLKNDLLESIKEKNNSDQKILELSNSLYQNKKFHEQFKSVNIL